MIKIHTKLFNQNSALFSHHRGIPAFNQHVFNYGNIKELHGKGFSLSRWILPEQHRNSPLVQSSYITIADHDDLIL